VFAPLFEGTLREERGKYPIIPDYRVVDDIVEEPGQPSSAPDLISSGPTVNREWWPTFVVQGNSHRLEARESKVSERRAVKTHVQSVWGGG